MADVLVLTTGRAPRGHRGRGLDRVAGGDGLLLVDGEDEGVLRGAEVQPADVGRPLPELRVLLPGDPAPHQVGLDVEVGQDATDLGGRDPDVLGQALGQLGVAPVAGRVGRLGGGGGHHSQAVVVVVDTGPAPAGGVLEAAEAVLLEAPAPLAHRLLAEAHLGGDLAVGHPLGVRLSLALRDLQSFPGEGLGLFHPPSEEEPAGSHPGRDPVQGGLIQLPRDLLEGLENSVGLLHVARLQCDPAAQGQGAAGSERIGESLRQRQQLGGVGEPQAASRSAWVPEAPSDGSTGPLATSRNSRAWR